MHKLLLTLSLAASSFYATILPIDIWPNVDSFLSLCDNMRSVSKIHRDITEASVLGKISRTGLVSKSTMDEINKNSGRLIVGCVIKNIALEDHRIRGLEQFMNIVYYRPNVTIEDFLKKLEENATKIRRVSDLEINIFYSEIFHRNCPNLSITFGAYAELIHSPLSDSLIEYLDIIAILRKCRFKQKLYINRELFKIIYSSLKKEDKHGLIGRMIEGIIYPYSRLNQTVVDDRLDFLCEISGVSPVHKRHPFKIGILANFSNTLSSFLSCCTR